MRKLIVAFALAGWAGIIALAWRLADRRISLCGTRWYAEEYEKACLIRTTAARDGVLVGGLAIALIFLVLTAFIWARSSNVKMRWRGTPQLRKPEHE